MLREIGDREYSKKTMKLKGQEEKPKLSSGQFQNGRKWSMYHPFHCSGNRPEVWFSFLNHRVASFSPTQILVTCVCQ